MAHSRVATSPPIYASDSGPLDAANEIALWLFEIARVLVRLDAPFATG